MAQLVSLAVIAALVIIDRVTKLAAAAYVAENGSREFLFGLFRLTRVNNTGAAFSSFSSNTRLLSVITLVIIVGCLIFLLIPRKKRNRFVDIMLTIIIAGGIGNEIDRFIDGFVIDFIEPLFVKFAVFNFADCCITVGAFLLVGYEIYTAFRDEKSKKKSVGETENKDG